jgi:hypothetical protein
VRLPTHILVGSSSISPPSASERGLSGPLSC